MMKEVCCLCGSVGLERMIESRVMDGLFFDMVQHSLTYGGTVKFPSTPAFRLLTFLEISGGYVNKEEALLLCWAKKKSVLPSALEHAKRNVSDLLTRLGVPKTVSFAKNRVVWE